MHFYYESIRLITILEEVLSVVYRPWLTHTPHETTSVGADAVIELDLKLKHFESELPAFLSWDERGLTLATEYSHLSDALQTLYRRQRNVLQARHVRRTSGVNSAN
jgi:hypothetical protein